MSITEETVRKIAKSAAIGLADDEVAKTTEQMNELLDYVSILSSVDTHRVEPTTHVHDVVNALSEDISSGRAYPIKKFEAMSPYFRNGYFVIPKIINN